MIKLEGTTTGKATVTASADIIWGDGPNDWRLTPTFQAIANNGIINLISATSEPKSSAWQAGMVITHTALPDLSAIPSEILTPAQRESAAKTCADACTADDKSTFCVALRDETAREMKGIKGLEDAHAAAVKASEAAIAALAATPAGDPSIGQRTAEVNLRKADVEAKKSDLDVGRQKAERKAFEYVAQHLETLSFCPKGIDPFKKAEALARDVRLRFPTRIWSGGFSYGHSQHKFVAPDESSALVAGTTNPSRWTGALAVTSVGNKTGFTLEGTLRADSAFESQTTTAKWCVPAGLVTRPDGSGADQAETCDEQPLGKPTRKRSVRLAAYVGAISMSDGKWRISGGPVASYSVTDAKDDDNPYEIGFEIPLYLSLTLSKSGYQGLIRITPTFTTLHSSDGSDESKFVLSIALLGDRSMFAVALQ